MAIYERIGATFNENFAKSQSLAYRTLLTDLRANQRVLIDQSIYTAKELDERCDELQSRLRDGGDDGRQTMEDRFAEWLTEPVEDKHEPEKELFQSR